MLLYYYQQMEVIGVLKRLKLMVNMEDKHASLFEECFLDELNSSLDYDSHDYQYIELLAFQEMLSKANGFLCNNQNVIIGFQVTDSKKRVLEHYRKQHPYICFQDIDD